jgi:hypothetical protein
MTAKNSRPRWLRKRILFPLCLLVCLPIAGVVAYLNSAASSIVIYNETGAALPPLLVSACGQTWTFPSLADQESIQLEPKRGGNQSAIHLEVASQPPWKWDGATIKPDGGQIVSIRIWSGGQIEAFTEISWWRKTFN